jgi:hypothetical protein
MLRAFFTFLGRLYNLLVSLLLAALVGIVTWACWGLYLEEKVAGQFHREGQLIRVKIEDTSRENRSWRDYLGNTSYLHFHYRQHPYTVRFVMDTLYVGSGDPVALLYHPGLDAFRQPGEQFRFQQSTNTSRLIRWSVVGTFSPENRWLVICLVLSGFFFFFVSGILVTLTGSHFLRTIGQWSVGLLLMGGALFFTYDSMAYYRYYQRIKTEGVRNQVKVIDTDRSSYSTRQSRHWKWYRYSARVRFENQEKVIPIEEADYEVLRPGDPLPVLYVKSLDDMMPVNYSLDYRQFFVTAFLWLMSIVFLWKIVISPDPKPART